MIISLHDSNLSRVCYIDNSLPDAMHYSDDSWNRYLQESTSTFDFKIYKTGNKYESFLNEKNYVSFSYGNSQYLFSIMRTEEDENSIKIYAENLNLELLNETKQPIDITTSNDLVWYLNVNYLIEGSGITVGINEVSDQTRKIKMESEQTGLARLISIANNFGAEIEFVTSLNPDGTLKSLVANFYKKYDGINYQGVGRDRQDVILEYGRNIESITRTVDKTDIFNTIVPVGKDGVGIESIEQTEYDDKGNVEFYTKAGNKAIYAPISKQLYRAQLANDKDGWIQRYHTLDGTSDIGKLYTLGLNELRKHAYPAVTYDVKGFFDLNIGDTVRVFDNGFSPILLLKARVAQQTISFSNPSQNKTTFGNIQALENRLSKDITSRLAQLVEEATPYRFEILSDNGLTFKNSTGSTTLTARVYKGSNVEEVSVDGFEWLIDGIKFGGTAKSQLVNASQVSGTAVVRYNAKSGETVIGGVEVTLQDVSDGTNGISPTVKVNPDTSLTIVDVQGTSTTPVLKGDKGDPGIKGSDGTSGIIVSSAAPTSPQNGQLWQDTSTTPQLVKKWTGASWVIWELYAQNLKADKLDAISGNLGTMVAGVIKILADIIVNAAGNTKKFGMLFTKKGLLSTGPVFNSSAQISDTKMAAASLTQGELRFFNMDYSKDLEAIQEYATSSANNGYIRFSSTPEKGDVLEITASNILLDGRTKQTSPWIEASSFAKYRVAFGTVTVSVGLVNDGTSNTIYLGSIPTALRPLDRRMFPAPAWWVDTSRDRHFQINADQGNMSLLSPYPGQEYRFEVTWTIPM